MPTNCVNCGAPLTGNKCLYCGTEYNGRGLSAVFDREDWTGVLTVGGKEYQVYMGSMSTEDIGCVSRNIMGELVYHPNMKHEFTLIEL